MRKFKEKKNETKKNELKCERTRNEMITMKTGVRRETLE